MAPLPSCGHIPWPIKSNRATITLWGGPRCRSEIYYHNCRSSDVCPRSLSNNSVELLLPVGPGVSAVVGWFGRSAAAHSGDPLKAIPQMTGAQECDHGKLMSYMGEGIRQVMGISSREMGKFVRRIRRLRKEMNKNRKSD